jgi:hypothetical protein
MNAIKHSLLVFLLWLGVAPFASAQSAPFRHELLMLLPDDFAVCLAMHDLRGNVARWEQSDWLKTFRQSPLGKSYLDAPELKQLQHLQSELKTHLGLDWPTLRDDLLGDTLIFSYTPGPKNKPDDERGLFLLHVRKPDLLLQFIDKLNAAQMKADKLKLTPLEHKGSTYYRRVEGGKTQFYFVKDSLAAVASKEEIIQAFLDRRAAPAKDNPWKARFQRAGAESAFVTLCINPRMLDAEILHANKKDDPLPGYWRALEGIFVTAGIKDEAEVRLSIQADVEKLPEWARPAFTQTMTASSLWQRFPEGSVLTIASKTDFAGAFDALKLLMPEKDRKKLVNDLQGTFGALLPRDPLNAILPNIGPDWGVCVLPAKDRAHLPQAMFALAVKPGTKEEPIDQALFKAADFFAGIAVLEHNRNNLDAIIRINTVKQVNAEVRYLSNDKFFPAGVQPACALKEGFLLFATSPEAIARFRLRDKIGSEPKESPLVRVSAAELAKLLEQRRETILHRLPEQNSKRNLDNIIGLLGLFDHLTLSQHGDGRQASWSIRLTPAAKAK